MLYIKLSVLKFGKCLKNNKKTVKGQSQRTYLTFWLARSAKQTWNTQKTGKVLSVPNAARNILLGKGFLSCSLAR